MEKYSNKHYQIRKFIDTGQTLNIKVNNRLSERDMPWLGNNAHFAPIIRAGHWNIEKSMGDIIPFLTQDCFQLLLWFGEGGLPWETWQPRVFIWFKYRECKVTPYAHYYYYDLLLVSIIKGVKGLYRREKTMLWKWMSVPRTEIVYYISLQHICIWDTLSCPVW